MLSLWIITPTRGHESMRASDYRTGAAFIRAARNAEEERYVRSNGSSITKVTTVPSLNSYRTIFDGFNLERIQVTR